MKTQPLNTAGQVVLSGAGAGTVSIGPRIGQRWNLSVASVTIPHPVVDEPECRIYMGGAATPDNFVDGTYTGSQDATDRVIGTPLAFGHRIFAVWSGGDAGAVATLSVTGTVDTDYR